MNGRLHEYEVFVVGGGQAGIPLAHALAQNGMRVALVERKHLGASTTDVRPPKQ